MFILENLANAVTGDNTGRFDSFSGGDWRYGEGKAIRLEGILLFTKRMLFLSLDSYMQQSEGPERVNAMVTTTTPVVLFYIGKNPNSIGFTQQVQ